MRTNKVCIIGGGVIGLSTAYYALKKGLDVTVIDSEPAEHPNNCCTGNAGMVVPSHFIPLAAPGVITKGLRWMFNPKSPFYIRPSLHPDMIRWCYLFLRHANARHVEASGELLRDLSLESRRMFIELAGTEDFGLVTKGLLMLCRTQHGLDEEAEVAQAAHRIGIEAHVLDAREAAALDPDVRMDITGAVHFPQDCHLNPARFLEVLRERVRSQGGTIRNGIRVDRFERQGNRISAAWSGQERIEAAQFVLAGGSWTPALLKSVGWNLPLQPGKGYSLTLPNPPERPHLCSILSEAKVAVTPIGNELRIGGTMEVGSMDFTVKPNRVRGIVESVGNYLPSIRPKAFEGIKPWVGLRPVSPDGLPYLGPVPTVDNLLVSSGHAMMGLSLAPASGAIMANLLVGEPGFREISGMALSRF